MNREIKFRGKSIMDNSYGEWLHSSGIKYGDDVELMYCDEDTSEEWNYIDKETLGQFTGLHDKNGKEIYEGDIVTNGDKNIRYIVEWYDTGLRARQYNNKSYIGLEYWKDVLEVIGNIYENSELLRGE